MHSAVSVNEEIATHHKDSVIVLEMLKQKVGFIKLLFGPRNAQADEEGKAKSAQLFWSGEPTGGDLLLDCMIPIESDKL